ncbi:MAG: PEGA domain protein [Candidatus Curtissbacteria bacterium GW2011_GWA1_40_9]|uniref:PEGA domain protein n=1 Tax=Candidatus Curtissbacteria bacterium GW2011_GWA1_40_9 TaxID=1618408 RepID=A0A0G0TME2_9BACT|nr:MAG: PEGA domain protein [Candidatus Curtissbacteria bacterium GW2011_GWA1_40_9]
MLSLSTETIKPVAEAKNFIKNLPLLICCLSLVLILPGCSAIGRTKQAALQVTTNPQASVFLDNKHLGKTPFFSDQLQDGTHTIKVSASEAVYVDKVELKNGALTVVNRDLNNSLFAQSGEVLWLTEGKNDVFIATNPPNSEVTIDGQYQGKSPILINDLDNGDHKVLITNTGYFDREFTIKNSNNYKLVANVTLASQTAKNQQSQEKSDQVKKVEILNTPQRFLKVRKEPDYTAQEIGQVELGTTYEVIQEIEDWVKISFDGKLGWIYSQYTKKI